MEEKGTTIENKIGGQRLSDTDIIEEAKSRARERYLLKQKSPSSQNDQSHLTDFESNLLQKYAGKGEDASSTDNPALFALTRPTTDDSTEAQKELLERRMTERPPETQSVRPPWFTEEKQNCNPLVANPKTKQEKNNKKGFLRSCNQIDFPSYTAEEMRVSYFSILSHVSIPEM